MSPEILLTMASAKGAPIEPAPGRGGIPEWVPADAGLACAGMEPMAFAACRYRWMRDDTAYAALLYDLINHGNRLARKEGWPEKVMRASRGQGPSRRPYLHDLAAMALLEEHNWWIIRRAVLWPDIMGVELRIWMRVLSPKYEALRERLERWNSVAYGHLIRAMRNPDE